MAADAIKAARSQAIIAALLASARAPAGQSVAVFLGRLAEGGFVVQSIGMPDKFMRNSRGEAIHEMRGEPVAIWQHAVEAASDDR